jgi:hypothetical protein
MDSEFEAGKGAGLVRGGDLGIPRGARTPTVTSTQGTSPGPGSWGPPLPVRLHLGTPLQRDKAVCTLLGSRLNCARILHCTWEGGFLGRVGAKHPPDVDLSPGRD